ncbi:MAG TPA: catalase family peroxidase [Kofleriaceae bacterium]
MYLAVGFAVATATATGTVLIRRAEAAPNKETFSPGQLVDALHAAFGTHRARAVHAKGIILEGTFSPDPQAATLTTAPHLQHTASKVTVRFSDFTGIPAIPDNVGDANPRGFAIRFKLPDGASTDIVGHSFNGFPTATSDEFRELLMAIAATKTSKEPLAKFLGSHPIAKTFLTTQKTPASYATISYFGVNAFQFTAKDGAKHFVRYQFVPDDGEHVLSAAEMANQSADYLQDEIRARVAKKSFSFKMYAQLAESSDVIENPSIAWPDSRKRVPLGVITIDKLSANTAAEDQALAYSPLNLPAGIAPADPMLEFRARAYPISVKGRR